MTNDAGFAPGLLVFFGFCITGMLTLGILRDSRAELKQYLKLFLIAYCIRYATSVLIYEGGLINILKDEDASGWIGGVALYEIWWKQGFTLFDVPYGLSYMFGDQQPGPAFLRQTNHGVYFVTGALFFITGSPYRLVAAALNGYAGAMTAVFSSLIAARLFGPSVARRTGWYICFFPSMIIWSAMTIKEPIVICLETVVLYHCVCLRQKSYWLADFACAVLASAALSPFRFYATWVTSIITVLCVLTRASSAADTDQLIKIERWAILLVPVFLFFSFTYLSREIQNQKVDLQYVGSFRNSVAKGGQAQGAGSGVETSFEITSGMGLVFAVLFGGAHLLLAPFPWQLGGASLRMLFTLPELLFWWYLFAFGVVPGTIHTLRHRLSETWMLFLFLLCFGVLYSAMFGNVGLIFRQRAQLLPVLLILGTQGRELAARNRSASRPPAATFSHFIASSDDPSPAIPCSITDRGISSILALLAYKRFSWRI